MPFMAEELYQNLVREHGRERAGLGAPGGMARFMTQARSTRRLNREMALVMKLASLGHAARNKANRKVRQPLAEVAFAVGNAEEHGRSGANMPSCWKMN